MGRPRSAIRVEETPRGFRVRFTAGGKMVVRTLPVVSAACAIDAALALQRAIDAGDDLPPSAIQGRATAPIRFDRMVDRNGPTPQHVPELGPCWVWTGSTDRNGYGQFSPDARHRKGRRWVYAHRYSWERATGAAPEMLVLHKCDNPSCVRPDHLFLGTDADNVADRARKKRHRGEQRVNAKLTDAQAAGIKDALARGESQRALARTHGVHPSTLQQLASGKCWDHVQSPSKAGPQ